MLARTNKKNMLMLFEIKATHLLHHFGEMLRAISNLCSKGHHVDLFLVYGSVPKPGLVQMKKTSWECCQDSRHVDRLY